VIAENYKFVLSLWVEISV